jgi:AraC-like DNA-binding protein
VAYREFEPPAELSGVVVCTWERAVPDAAAPQAKRVLPDGCTDLVWRDGELVVAGPDSGPAVTPLAPGETVIGLRLRPGAAGRALGLPASELRDTRVPLEELWGALGRDIEERIAGAGDAEPRRHALEEVALAHLADAGGPDALVLAATRWLGRPGARVGSLSDALATSERQLLRRFKAAVGYGPKTLDRVLRFQRFLALAPAVARGEDELARAAAELGYADQAHLSRECVSLSGLTPTQLVAAWTAGES